MCHFADSQEGEAKWMVEKMRKLYDQSVPFWDMTVLYRAHYVARAVEQVLLREKVPYTLYSGTQFFNRINQRCAQLPADDCVQRRPFLPAGGQHLKAKPGQTADGFFTGIRGKEWLTLYQAHQTNLEDPIFKGAKARQFIFLVEMFAAEYEGRPVSEVLSAVLNESSYEAMLRTEGSQERRDNLAELKQSVYEFETTCGEEVTLPHYLSYAVLLNNAYTEAPEDRVKLMTVLAAKGLEFPYVFLCGMNEGTFPSRRVLTRQAMEEERRLAFVALTRAKKGLYLSEADSHNFEGAPRFPSRFLLDINQSLLVSTFPPQEGLIREAQSYIEHSQKYLPDGDSDFVCPVGQRVMHSTFGTGTVLEVDMGKGAHSVKFDVSWIHSGKSHSRRS